MDSISEKLHKYAEFMRDYNTLKGRSGTQSAMTIPYHPDFNITTLSDVRGMAGVVCKDCHLFYSIILYGEDSIWQSHLCDPARVAEVHAKPDREEAWKSMILKRLPDFIKSQVDRAVSGKKYISASSDAPWSKALSILPQSMPIKLDSSDPNHYVLRAVRDSEKGEKTLANDNEMMDLIRKTNTTFALFEVNINGSRRNFWVRVDFSQKRTQLEEMFEKEARKLDALMAKEFQDFLKESSVDEETLASDTAVQISCVVQDSNGVITYVGWDRHLYLVQNIVDDIRNNRYQFYTYKNGRKADVSAKQHPTSGRWFLTTDPEDTRENNLDFLPRCPEVIL